MPSSSFRNESALKSAIVKYLRANGIFCWRAGAGPYQQAGIPDICGCLPDGQFLAIEAKMPGEDLTALQAKTIKQIPFGAVVIVAYSLDDVRVEIEPILRKIERTK